jgi:hypothetical protein
MPRHCKICKHPQREEIEAKLSGSWERSLRAIGHQYGVSKDSLSRHSQAHMHPIEDDGQTVADSTRAESAPPAEREYQDFLRQWERRLWVAPANLQAAFLAEFNADRASKLADLLAQAVDRGDLVQRAGLYFRTDQLTSWLNASDATA